MRLPRHLDGALIVIIAASSAYLIWEKIHESQVSALILQLGNEDLITEAFVTTHKTALARLNHEKAELETLATTDKPSHYSKSLAGWIKALERSGYGPTHIANVDQNYSALFRKLNLPREKTDALRILLADQDQAKMEAIRLSSENGLYLDDVPDRALILAAGTQDIDSAINGLIGPDDFRTFKDYESTVGAREFLIRPFNNHQQVLGSALNDDQIDRLVVSASDQDFGVETGLMGKIAAPISEGTLKTASSVLNDEQLLAFQHYVEVWNARRTMTTIFQARLLDQYQAQHHVTP